MVIRRQSKEIKYSSLPHISGGNGGSWRSRGKGVGGAVCVDTCDRRVIYRWPWSSPPTPAAPAPRAWRAGGGRAAPREASASHKNLPLPPPKHAQVYVAGMAHIPHYYSDPPTVWSTYSGSDSLCATSILKARSCSLKLAPFSSTVGRSVLCYINSKYQRWLGLPKSEASLKSTALPPNVRQ